MSLRDLRRTGRIERYDTIVIGAGLAGLAMGYHLSLHDADFLILDGATQVGDNWRTHCPDNEEIADYLERYAQRFDLPVRLNTRVDSLDWNGHRFVVETGTIYYEAHRIVIATGSSRTGFTNHDATAGVPGLYSLGWRFQDTMTSALLEGVNADAARIATQILRAVFD